MEKREDKERGERERERGEQIKRTPRGREKGKGREQ